MPFGGVFVTGHDPDYHAVAAGANNAGAINIIKRAIAYVTHDNANPRLLLVTDLRTPNGDGVDSRLGITAAGFTTFDVADFGSGASGVLDLHTVNFSNYDAVVVASDYGGWLRQDELDVLNARSSELINYVNNGGGVVAFNEAGNRNNIKADGTVDPTIYVGTTGNRFGFLPFVVSEVSQHETETGFTVTSDGTTLGLTNSDVNGNVAHSIFTPVMGMLVVDRNDQGQIMSLAVRGKRIGPQGPLSFEYAVKFICGRAAREAAPGVPTPVAPGTYFTAINILNASDTDVTFTKMFVIAGHMEEPGPRPMGPFTAKLPAGHATEIDCVDIHRHTERASGFLKGFVILQCSVELDVVAVYTAAGNTGDVETLEIERVLPRKQELPPSTTKPQ